jgi:hypothetical protein
MIGEAGASRANPIFANIMLEPERVVYEVAGAVYRNVCQLMLV